MLAHLLVALIKQPGSATKAARPTPCWVGPSYLAGDISRGGEGLVGWWMAGF